MAKERQRLKLDLEALLPGDTITIGTNTIDIRPMGIGQISAISRKFGSFVLALQKEGVTFDNYNAPENLMKIATVLLEQSPEILEEASNIAIEDLNELPISIIIELLDKILGVNLKSKETLEKNFLSLVSKFQTLPQVAKSKGKKTKKR